MKIYSQEIKDGLSQAFADIKPISIASKLEMIASDQIVHRMEVQKAISNKTIPQSDDKQLLYTKSLMVSSNWNINDDIFFKNYTWAARKSPLYKPNNLDHIEAEVVGAIIDTWVIDNDGNVLSDDTELKDLPDLFHVCNSDVIYTHWQTEDKIEKVAKLVAEIKEGTKYVSMECLFPDFDYGILAPDNSFYIVARQEDTSFLTKHLRSFGGTGIYDSHRVGRVLKDFSFSGKGYTSNPANPNSIIFDFSEPKSEIVFASISSENPFSKKNSVLIQYNKTQAEINSENKMSEEILKSVQTENTQLKADIKALQDKLSNVSTEHLQAQITDLTSKLEAAYKMTDEEKKKAKDKEDKAKADEANLIAVKAELEVKATELNQLKLQVSKSNRVSILMNGGFDKEYSEAKVALFEDLKDAQFEALAKELVEANKNKITVASTQSGKEEAVASTELVVAPVVEAPLAAAAASTKEAEAKEMEIFQAAVAQVVNVKAKKATK